MCRHRRPSGFQEWAKGNTIDRFLEKERILKEELLKENADMEAKEKIDIATINEGEVNLETGENEKGRGNNGDQVVGIGRGTEEGRLKEEVPTNVGTGWKGSQLENGRLERRLALRELGVSSLPVLVHHSKLQRPWGSVRLTGPHRTSSNPNLSKR